MNYYFSSMTSFSTAFYFIILVVRRHLVLLFSFIILEVMMSSKPVIHIAEWESASITQSLRKLAPELTIRRVPVPDFCKKISIM